MHFSTHQNNLIEQIHIALGKNKSGLIQDFKLILNKGCTLYQTKSFDFWIRTLDEIVCEEIPITIYGYKEALGAAEYLHDLNRNQIQGMICCICESLFTYSNENDLCELFGIFHSYYSLVEKCVFKESEMGCVQGIEYMSPHSFRIAKISELSVAVEEFYA